MAGCSRCGKTSRGPTTMPVDRTAPPRVGAMPVRFMVNGKTFATRAAAQDYASQHPGSVIKQM